MLDTLFTAFSHILVLDTETTGVNPRTDEIIELSALLLSRDGTQQILDELVCLSPGRRLPPFISSLTGITEAELSQAGISKAQAAEALSSLLTREKLLLVAYNAQFDLCFLYYFLQRQGLSTALQGIKMLDAMTVYKDRRPYPHKLKDAISAYSLDVQNSHRALDDTRATLALLQAMAEERDDLLQYINLFGYNPKYGVPGPRISSIQYRPQSSRSFSCRLYEI